ncbi:MAG: hypothetical protein GY810_22855 [Aureispira sp.]|nr:hypothetical protein [Aureispira sp.]
MMKRFLYPLILLGICIGSLSAQNEEKSFLVGESIDKAGAQRMLTQKMAKAYVSLYIGLDIENSGRELNNSVELFESRLDELKELKINARYTQLLSRVEKQWEPYKKIIQSIPNKNNIDQLIVDNTKILESCDLVVEQIKRYASRFSDESNLSKRNNNIVHLENLAGKQRMLSQRVVFYYLANQAIIGDDPQIQEGLELALNDYKEALTTLMSSPENTPEIDYRLALLSKEWEKVAASCKEKTIDAERTSEVLVLGNKLLEEMDEVTKLYEHLIDSRIAAMMLNNAIEMAGEQAVLTQKVAKAYIESGIHPENTEHKQNVNSYVQTFEKHIDELKLFAPMPEITGALDVVDELWTEYRNIVLSTASKSSAQKLLASNNELLRACDNVVMLLEMYSKVYKGSVNRHNSELARWLNKITHQEMLTERILMYSFAASWGIGGEDIEKNLEKVGGEYLENLSELGNIQSNSSETKEKMDQVLQQWELSKTHLSDIERHSQELIDWAIDLSQDLYVLTATFKHQIHSMVAEEAIDKAAHQCMLTQELATAYIAIGMGLNSNVYRQRIEKDKLVFQRQLEELKTFAKSAKTKQALGEVNQLWNTYQTNFSGSISKDRAMKLLNESQEILDICEEVVQSIEEDISSKSIIAVNQAAHLRTYTEQVWLHYLAYKWGLPNFKKSKVMTTLGTLKQGVNVLNNREDNTSNIQNILKSIEVYNTRLEGLFEDIDNIELYRVLTIHNVLLLETEKLTKAYEENSLF